jgi:hypothetical protein
MKDDVWRHPARAGDLETHGTQPIEQVTIDALPRLGFHA